MVVIGEELEKRKGIKHDARLITKERKNYPQKVMIGRDQKDANVKGAFAIKDAGKVKGKQVLFVDDIYDSGATANECAKVLKMAGASGVNALCLTETIRFYTHQIIDGKESVLDWMISST